MERIFPDARCVFLSDIHLGWRFSKPSLLNRLFSECRPEKLYLVGDTFEWLYRLHLDSENTIKAFFDSLKRLEHQGTQITVLPGNHDWQLAEVSAHADWDVQPYAIHETLAGMKLLVTHGDVFDLQADNGRSPWKRFGGWLYPKLVRFGEALHRHGVGADQRREHWCTRIKLSSRRAREHIADFEHFMVHLAERHDCGGVVCGHIHRPDAKRVAGQWYFNCGDWIEHQSFIFEDERGQLGLFNHAVQAFVVSQAA